MQFHNVLIYVLMVAAVITALMDHWIDTWVILAVVVINALIGFIQEGKAEKALESIRQMLSLEAVVVRDGKKQTIEAEDLFRAISSCSNRAIKCLQISGWCNPKIFVWKNRRSQANQPCRKKH
jgi:hypothetical protein